MDFTVSSANVPAAGQGAACLPNPGAKTHKRREAPMADTAAMFDWDDLKHFLAVASHGSTIAAAKALGVNQSTVHRRLEELEKRLGRRLAVRGPAGYRLTEFGR